MLDSRRIDSVTIHAATPSILHKLKVEVLAYISIKLGALGGHHGLYGSLNLNARGEPYWPVHAYMRLPLASSLSYTWGRCDSTLLSELRDKHNSRDLCTHQSALYQKHKSSLRRMHSFACSTFTDQLDLLLLLLRDVAQASDNSLSTPSLMPKKFRKPQIFTPVPFSVCAFANCCNMPKTPALPPVTSLSSVSLSRLSTPPASAKS